MAVLGLCMNLAGPVFLLLWHKLPLHPNRWAKAMACALAVPVVGFVYCASMGIIFLLANPIMVQESGGFPLAIFCQFFKPLKIFIIALLAFFFGRGLPAGNDLPGKKFEIFARITIITSIVIT